MMIIFMTIFLILTVEPSRTDGAESLPAITGFTDEDKEGDYESYEKIKCSATGENIEYTWKQYRLDDNTILIKEYDKNSREDPDVTVDSDGSIRFAKLRLSDDGYYQCFAKNSKGTVFSRKLKLRVKNVSPFEASDPVNLPPKDVGDIVTLQCPPLKRPQMPYNGSFGYAELWGKQDGRQFHPFGLGKNILKTTGKLTFSPLEQKDCNFYEGKPIICKVDAGTRVYKSPEFLFRCSKKQVDMATKRKKPIWIQTPDKVEIAVEGKEASLTCVAGGVPTPDVAWYFNNDTKITTGINGYELQAAEFNRILRIKSVSKTKHEGAYTCRANNTEGHKTKYTFLKVQVRPRFHQKVMESKIFEMYKKYSLSYEAEGVPEPKYSWWKNGQELSDLRGKKVLEFTKVDLSATGVYQCVAENVVGMSIKSTLVEVKAHRPKFKKFGPFFLFRGKMGRLSCEIEAIPKADKFVWYRNGQQIKTNTSGRHFLSASGTLLIKDVTKTDEGNYMCTASNVIGNKSAEAELTTYKKTLFQVQPNDTSVQEGEGFHLLCGVSHDKRLQLKYRWQKDGVPLESKTHLEISFDGEISRLQISKAQLDDAGLYECVAYTLPMKSEETASAIVKIKVPSAPVDVNVIPFGKYILLRWGPPSSAYGVIKGYTVGITNSVNQGVYPKLVTKLGANRLEHLFTNLNYTTSYILGVAGENNAGIGAAVYINTTTVARREPAKPAVPLVKAISTSSVNVTFEYGFGGGYPLQFMVKYREAGSHNTTQNTSHVQEDYLESKWQNTTADRWIEITGLSGNTLYEFRTLGTNELGSGLMSDPAFGRPVRYLEKKAFYTTNWFIALVVLGVLVLAVFPIVIFMRQRGGKYNVEKREKTKGTVMETYPTEDSGYINCHVERKKSNLASKSRFSDTSIEKPPPDSPPESDSDSLECYGEGEKFSDAGSFVEEYGEKYTLDPIGGTFV